MSDYHEGPLHLQDAADGGVLILCAVGHLFHHVRKGEWAGSYWEMRMGFDRDKPERCYGAMRQAVPA